MEDRNHVLGVALGALLFPMLDLGIDQMVLGYFLLTLAGIDIRYREIPDTATEALVLIALFSVPYMSNGDAFVYVVFIVVFKCLQLKGGLGGGDFKLYCSMLIITPGMLFMGIMIWCSLFGLLYYLVNRGDTDSSVPMVPVILLSFIVVLL